MKSVVVGLMAVVFFFFSSCTNNQAKLNELQRQIQAVNRELSDLNKNYASLNADLDAARERVKKVDELQYIKKEEERKELVNSQIAYMKKLQSNIQVVQDKISEKQERMAMLSTQAAKLE